ncbi:class I SAM-dependent methyltransferase [Anaerobacillus sp. HL2]|nr:class I SAM-dependent methyltransferase [Anaerobacillus sp. HL2]
MIEIARDKLADYSNITYLIEDGENLQVSKPFDLIVSSAVFQWFNNYLKPFTQYYNFLKKRVCLFLIPS